MPRYSWEGRTAAGQLVRGELEAPSREAVSQSLQSKGIMVVRVEEPSGAPEASPADPSAPPPAPPRRDGGSFFDRFFYVCVAAVSIAISVGIGYLSPIHVYDCARQTSGSVDCTVEKRIHGLIPIGDLHFSRIMSVEVMSGVSSETMAERNRRLSSGGQEQSWEALQLVCADGTQWRSPNSSWPLGTTLGDVRSGIQGLLDTDSPASYHASVGDKVARVVALAFLAPIGFMLLGLPLRL